MEHLQTTELSATPKTPLAPQVLEQPTNTQDFVDDKSLDTPSPFELDKKGVYLTLTKDGNKKFTKISGAIAVVRLLSDREGDNWARVVQFRDHNGVKRQTILQDKLFFTNKGSAVKEKLVAKGLFVHPNYEFALIEYLMTSSPTHRGFLALQNGWLNTDKEKLAFILPNGEIVGHCDESVFLDTEGRQNPYEEKGTLEDWQDNLSKKCIGNSRLVFGIAAVLASPCFRLVGEIGGGFHIFGSSSRGKTTWLKVAASVVGGEKAIESWDKTRFSLETSAVVRNDGPTMLDEISECDKAIVADTAYSLANGRGKGRWDKEQARWTTCILSNGEHSLPDYLGSKLQAGMEARCVSIPAEPQGAKFGVFETLHDFNEGGKYADFLVEQASLFHGTAMRPFIEILADNPNAFRQKYKQLLSENESVIPFNADGQVKRVFKRLMIVAAAGEYATEQGITGWVQGEALKAVLSCAKDWLAERETPGNLKVKQVLERFKDFFEKNAEGGFIDISALYQRDYNPPRNPAGYLKCENPYDEGTNHCHKDQKYYFIMPTTFDKIAAGLGKRFAISALKSEGWLHTPETGRSTTHIEIHDRHVRVYCFNRILWDWESTPQSEEDKSVSAES